MFKRCLNGLKSICSQVYEATLAGFLNVSWVWFFVVKESSAALPCNGCECRGREDERFTSPGRPAAQSLAPGWRGHGRGTERRGKLHISLMVSSAVIA